MDVKQIMNDTIAIECPSCKGRGCPKCDFLGVQELVDDGKKIAILCPFCEGSGCTKCDFTGIQKMKS